MDEVMPNYPWMAQTGRSTGLNYGYRFDRFLQADDFDADGALKTDGEGKPLLPVMSLGSPRPGDALFKDLNGDGKIDGNDKTYFGYSQRPDYVLGLLGGFRYKNFEISMQWTAGCMPRVCSAANTVMLSAVQTAVRCSNSWPTGVGRPRTPMRVFHG